MADTLRDNGVSCQICSGVIQLKSRGVTVILHRNVIND
jgi:hypothetical protein